MATADNQDLMQRILALNFANSSSTQQALAQASIRTKFPDFQATQIPFGSTVNVTNNGISGLGKMAIAALSALGIGAAAMGLAQGNSRAPSPAIQSPATTNTTTPVTQTVTPATPTTTTDGTAAGQPLTVEGTLSWEVTPDGGLTVQPSTVGSGH